MAHINTQIAEEIMQRLAAVTAVEGRVYRSRVHEIPDNKLPCLLLMHEGERIEHSVARASQRLQTRTSSWGIYALCKIVGKETAGLEDYLFDVAAQVETALCTGPGGIVHDLQLTNTDVQLNAEAEKPRGYLRMGIEIKTSAREGAPETGIQTND